MSRRESILSNIVKPILQRQGSQNSVGGRQSDDDKENTHSDLVKGIESQVALAKQGNNKLCADCGFPGPQWAVEHIGAFVCTKCSGVHRQIAEDPSKIASVSLAEWSMATLKHMASRGNEVVNAEYEANMPENAKPHPESSFRDTFTFIKAKYKEKKFHKDRPAPSNDRPPAARRLQTGPPQLHRKRDGSSRDLVEGEIQMSPLLRSKSAPKGMTMRDAEGVEMDNDDAALGGDEPHYIGVLNLSLFKGKSLPASDMNGLSDPYVKFCVGDREVQSEVIQKTLNPVWKEKLRLEVTQDDLKKPLRVEVYDFDVITEDDFLGYGEVMVGDLAAEDIKHDIEMPISLEGVMMKQRMLMQPDFTWGRKWVKNGVREKEGAGSASSYSNLGKAQQKEYQMNDKAINPHAIQNKSFSDQAQELVKRSRKFVYYYFSSCCHPKEKEESIIHFRVQLKKY